jgi:ribosomal protein S18 acetylase RimI-like enzyme
MKIAFESELSPDVRQRIELGVDLHNVAATQLPDFYVPAFTLREPGGEVRGGLIGEIWGGWMHISYLWVDAPLRRRGWARKLVRAAERYAASRGVHDIHLETHSFQARPLYEALGYEVFATLDDFPPGHQKHFLRKTITTEGHRGAPRKRKPL